MTDAIAFDEFFSALHGQQPFPWQRMLAERVVTTGWPTGIDLPTASGKTAVLDIAVWALASAAQVPQPRRVFFVIDRRIVVDEAFERAKTIARRLETAIDDPDDPLRPVSRRLLALGGDVPLHVAALRGGIYRDHAWARTPVQPLICVSTVDQVGSRLLFRGYGLSGRDGNQLPIHAGLVGNDALMILDEAHLSRPFEETLEAIDRYRAWSETPLSLPWHVVKMSATLGSASAFPDDRERTTALDDPRLAVRGNARKVAQLDVVADERFCERIVERASELARADRVRVVGVVVNRVAAARGIFDLLAGTGDRVLLTGRSRPVDRERLLREFLPRMRAGRQRQEDDAPLFVVATQCIEVGADLDFDALVTEIAPLDSLRQRFGRLDRLGVLGETRAVIMARKSSVAARADDVVYGPSVAQTWRWLDGVARTEGRVKEVDLGIVAVEEILPPEETLLPLLAPRPSAPVLLPAHVDQLSQTSPRPAVEPDPGLFLHGPEAGPADVAVVWRADIRDDEPRQWADVVGLAPPKSGEALPLRPSDLRRWSNARSIDDTLADVEGREGDGNEPSSDLRVLRWRGVDDGETRGISIADVRPGDTIVIPASRGGLDRFGWNPTSTAPVEDVAETAAAIARSRPMLRLHPSVLTERGPAVVGVLEVLRSCLGVDDVDDLVSADVVLEQIVADQSAEPGDPIVATARELLADRRKRAIRYPDDSGLVLVGSRRAGVDPALTDEGDASSYTAPSTPVTLTQHAASVADRAKTFARACLLPEDVVDDVVTAALLHDLGKIDSRFQLILHGGDAVAAAVAVDGPLAKSRVLEHDLAARRRVRERSGYPPGYRHEGASVALAASSDSILAGVSDPDLVLHLIASHHGHCRPFLPVFDDSEPVRLELEVEDARLEASSAHGLERLDAGIADRYFRCVRRYGWWGLALLESVVRLADHRTSEAEGGET